MMNREVRYAGLLDKGNPSWILDIKEILLDGAIGKYVAISMKLR